MIDGSAGMAKWRLKNIIRDDRATVPCGRWVIVARQPKTMGGLAMQAIAPDMWLKAAAFIDQRSKPRYRCEVRR